MTSAWLTDGLGNGAGVSSAGPTITLTGAGTPTTAATFTATSVRDATSTAITTLVTSPTTGSAGLINFHNAKGETGYDTGVVVQGQRGAPDCGYQCVMSGSDVTFHNRNFSTYARSVTNFYRWLWMSSGTLSDYDPEEDNGANTLLNPGGSDYAMYRISPLLPLASDCVITRQSQTTAAL